MLAASHDFGRPALVVFGAIRDLSVKREDVDQRLIWALVVACQQEGVSVLACEMGQRYRIDGITGVVRGAWAREFIRSPLLWPHPLIGRRLKAGQWPLLRNLNVAVIENVIFRGVHGSCPARA